MASPPEFIDHYKTLGLPGATDNIGFIEWAYNLARKAKLSDPAGHKERQKRVAVAWEVLRNEKSRAAYMNENRRFFEMPPAPTPRPAPCSRAQPAPGSTKSPGGGGCPAPPTASFSPSSAGGLSKRPAEEDLSASIKRYCASDAHSPPGTPSSCPSKEWPPGTRVFAASSSGGPRNNPFRDRNNNSEEGPHAAFRFIPSYDQARIMVVDGVVNALEEMGTTRLERETVRRRLLRQGSGVGGAATSVVEIMSELR